MTEGSRSFCCFSRRDAADQIANQCCHKNCSDIILNHLDPLTFTTNNHFVFERAVVQPFITDLFIHVWVYCKSMSPNRPNIRELGYIERSELEFHFQTKSSTTMSKRLFWKHLLPIVECDQYNMWLKDYIPIKYIRHYKKHLIESFEDRLTIDLAIIKKDIVDLDDAQLTLLALDSPRSLYNDQLLFWLMLLTCMEMSEKQGSIKAVQFFFETEIRLFKYRMSFRSEVSQIRIWHQLGQVLHMNEIRAYNVLSPDSSFKLKCLSIRFKTNYFLKTNVFVFAHLLDINECMIENGKVYIPCGYKINVIAILYYQHLRYLWIKTYNQFYWSQSQDNHRHLDFETVTTDNDYPLYQLNFSDLPGRLIDHWYDIEQLNCVIDRCYAQHLDPIKINRITIAALQNIDDTIPPAIANRGQTWNGAFESVPIKVKDFRKFGPRCLVELFRLGLRPTDHNHLNNSQRLLIGQFARVAGIEHQELIDKLNEQMTTPNAHMIKETIAASSFAYKPTYQPRQIKCETMIKCSLCPYTLQGHGVENAQDMCAAHLRRTLDLPPNAIRHIYKPLFYLRYHKSRKLDVEYEH